jgi:hypothetical protein
MSAINGGGVKTGLNGMKKFSAQPPNKTGKFGPASKVRRLNQNMHKSTYKIFLGHQSSIGHSVSTQETSRAVICRQFTAKKSILRFSAPK